MTDIADRINALVAHHKPRLGLDTWLIKVECSPVILYEGGDHVKAEAMCTPFWKYLTATLRFSTEKMGELDDEEFEETVLHELMHVILAELDCRDEHEERVATLLSRAFLGRFTKGE